MSTARINDFVTLGPNCPLGLIAGPCVLESEELALQIAQEAADICGRLGVGYIFKASFDKANRTSINSYRGMSMENGLKTLERVKSEVGAPVLTDIHESTQAKRVAEIADVLQIPALLCRQTDLLLAAAKTGRAINVKKGQFMAPWDLTHVVDKLRAGGAKNILLTERGTSFGYNNLVVDYRSFPELRKSGCPLVFDAGHSVQLPGGLKSSSGGQGEYIETLACAAAAVGIHALFVEIHPNPELSPSDGPSTLPLSDLEPLIKKVLAISSASRG